MRFFLILLYLIICPAAHSKTKTESPHIAKAREKMRDLLVKDIKPCYNNLLKNYQESGKGDQMLEGKITISFKLEKIGKAVDVAIKKSDIMSPEVFEMCIRPAVENAEFYTPPAGTEAVIIYPFIFSAK